MHRFLLFIVKFFSFVPLKQEKCNVIIEGCSNKTIKLLFLYEET